MNSVFLRNPVIQYRVQQLLGVAWPLPNVAAEARNEKNNRNSCHPDRSQHGRFARRGADAKSFLQYD
jgi:hypothetical protein